MNYFRSAKLDSLAIKCKFARTVLCLCLFLAGWAGKAQNTLPTEKTVQLQVKGVSAEKFLELISLQTSIRFSYNPQIFVGFPVISADLRGVSVREALHQAFGNAIKLKAKNNYIILQKSNLPIQSQQAETRPVRVLISGYVIEKTTQARVAQASVYEKSSLSATLSDANGFFEFQVETLQSELKISFAKAHYYPQTLTLPAQNTPFVRVELEPMPNLKPLDSKGLPALPTPARYTPLVPKIQIIHAQNVKESFWRKAQFSFLPMLGTNHILSGLVRNSFSFNALIGYNAGVSEFELGGFANLNRGDVEKVQIGGFFNAVAGKVKGVQIAGFFNAVRDSVSGVQLGGFLNVNRRHTSGVQAGGYLNICAEGIKGAQVSGLMNINLRQTIGFQVAGLINVALGRMEAVQVAGLINVAGKSKQGWQVGLFNYADSSQNLKQVGLVNIVRHGGYKNLELSMNEQLFMNFIIRSGTPYFYTLAQIGIRPYPAKPFWQYGYGVGCRIFQKRKWEMNTEVVAYHLLRSLGRAYQVRPFENFGARYQLYLTRILSKHWAISLAGALDFSSLHAEGTDYAEAKNLARTVFLNTILDKRDNRLSSGLTIGIRKILN